MEPLGDFDPEKVTWYCLLRNGEEAICFQKISNYVAPTWPEGAVPQQMHLDFHVKDLDLAEERVLASGSDEISISICDEFSRVLRPDRSSVLLDSQLRMWRCSATPKSTSTSLFPSLVGPFGFRQPICHRVCDR